MTLPKWATTVTPFSKTLALIIFVTFPIVGFVLGIQYQTRVNYPITKPLVNTVASTIAPISSLAISTSFQKILKDNCIDGKILIDKIPININFDILKTKIDKETYSHFYIEQEQKQKISCVYEKNIGGYAYVGDNGNGGILKIYDNQSPDPQCMECYGFIMGDIPLSNGFTLGILTPGSDGPMNAKSISADGVLVKTLVLPNNEEVFIDSKIQLIDSNDLRLKNILSKYLKEADLRPKGVEIQKEIASTLFNNISTLQEPEKTRLQNQENLINAFSIKENSLCIDSNGQCQGKLDGTSCEFGKWCDEQGRICGGESCIGLELGRCLTNKCESIK